MLVDAGKSLAESAVEYQVEQVKYQVDQVPAVVNSLAPQTGAPSAQSTQPTVPVIDSPVAGGYLRVLIRQNSGSTWVCVRGEAGGSGFGGRLSVDGPMAGQPTVDSNSTACQSAPDNRAPGPHPLAGPGMVGGQHFLLDTWTSLTDA